MNAKQAMSARKVWRTQYVPWQDCSDERKDVLREAWAMGELSYKLSPAQREVYDEIRRWSVSPTRQGRTFVMDIGRRFGKSSIIVLIAFEDCIRNPGWRWPYYGPKHKDLMKFIREHLAKILIDCPPDLMPEWTKSDSTYRFPNGSQVEFIGLDVNPDGARGGSFDGCGLDEAAFFDNLENIVQSVLVPQMMGKPHARIYAGSTPPISPSHYWSTAMVPKATLEQACLTRTIDDSDIYTTEEKEEFIAELGGRKAARCRRELFTEHVTDETLAIIPEFREVMEHIMVTLEPPYWRDCYESMDPGWNDHTAVLFGYWNFAESFLYVEDELSSPRMNSALIADLIKKKEAVLWSGILCHRGRTMNPRPQPFMRVSDNDPRLLFDLANDHKLVFTATAKDNLDQQINSLRVAISEKKIRIHPRCKMLKMQLLNGVWKNEARKVFAREGSDLGHFDLIAALVYLWRCVSMYKGRNPAPREEKFVAREDLASGGSIHGTEKNDGKSKWSRRSGRLWLKGAK